MVLPLNRAWNRDDITGLLDAQIPESRSLDYKLSLPSEKETNHDKFLADVSAFANTSGGAIVYGIAEKGSLPDKIEGIASSDVENDILRLQQIITSGLDPNLTGIHFDPIEMGDLTVLVIRIPQSILAPHRLSKGTPKFYSRSTLGNSPMDTSEIRASFIASTQWSERLREWRSGRISLLSHNASDLRLENKGQGFFHIMPLESFARPREVSTELLIEVQDELLPVAIRSGWGRTYCLEGVAQSAFDSEGKTLAYTLLFRNGCLEITCPARHGDNLMADKLYDNVLKYILKHVECLNRLGFGYPFYISLSLFGCKGTKPYIAPGRDFGLFNTRNFSQEPAMFPIFEVSGPEKWEEALWNCMDLIANSIGIPSAHYFIERQASPSEKS